MQTSWRFIGRNVSQHQTSYMLLCIRSLLQALHTPSGYLDSFYAHCTDQRMECSVGCNELEVSGGKLFWPNTKWYDRMPEWNSEWLMISMKIEFVDIRIQIRCVCQRTIVFVFWPDIKTARKKGIFPSAFNKFLLKGRIFLKFYFCEFLYMSRKFKLYANTTILSQVIKNSEYECLSHWVNSLQRS